MEQQAKYECHSINTAAAVERLIGKGMNSLIASGGLLVG